MQPHSDQTKKEFGDKVANGTPQGKAYGDVTGTTGGTASVGAARWMRLPEIQEHIQRSSQKNLLEAGIIAIAKLKAGLNAINTKKITPTGVKLITLGLQMGGVLDRRVELKINDSPDLDPEVLAALKVLGNQALAGVQDMRPGPDGTFEVIDNQESACAPDGR